MVVNYLRREDRTEKTVPRYACNYIFELQGNQLPKVCVVIDGGWHERVPSLSWEASGKELVAIAKEFLEKKLNDDWRPTDENNTLELPDDQMEYRVRHHSFPL